jgi:glycogen operon protein
MLGLFANRICGSADIYTNSGKGPEGSINFVTCHDGFTLNDLVSYRNKHNEANGENNHDGSDTNLSENYGVEGETKDAGIESLRKRQIKNFLLTLLISRGVPMLLGGDEFRRTQGGNNNAYCQDNETSWYDWSLLEQHKEIFRFTCGMIAFRRSHPILSKEQFYTDVEIQWFGPQGGSPDWADPKEKQFACLVLEDNQSALYLMFNAGAEWVDFCLPHVLLGTLWHLAVDTSHEAPKDIFAEGEEPLLENPLTYRLSPQSSAILLARGPDSQIRQAELTKAQ